MNFKLQNNTKLLWKYKVESHKFIHKQFVGQNNEDEVPATRRKRDLHSTVSTPCLLNSADSSYTSLHLSSTHNQQNEVKG